MEPNEQQFASAHELWLEVNRRLTILEGEDWHGNLAPEFGEHVDGRPMVRVGSSFFFRPDPDERPELIAEIAGELQRWIDAEAVVVDTFHRINAGQG
jgi:hypothetical protein